MNTITGTNNADSLTGTDSGDEISGLAGNDTIDGGLGGDIVFGGDGDDTITDTGTPVAGQNILSGFLIEDFVFLDAGGNPDSIPPEAENPGNIGLEVGGTVNFPNAADQITFAVNDDDSTFDDGFVEQSGAFATIAEDLTIGGITFPAGQVAEAETNIITQTPDGDTITFTLITIVPPGNTNTQNQGDAVLLVADAPIPPGVPLTITGFTDGPQIPYNTLTPPPDTIFGGAGNDTIDAGEENDFVDAGADDDVVFAGVGDDSLFGGDGIDTLDTSDATDSVTIDLGAGTASGNDIGDDTIAEFEAVIGGSGNDTITGDAAANTVSGGAGDDSISTGDGNDVITVGEGDDVVDGGGVSGGDPLLDNDTLVIDAPDGGSFDVIFAGGDDESGTVNVLDSGGNTVSTITFSEIESIVCFARGTMIETPTGAVAIEDLAAGDLVLTHDNGAQPIRWIGSRTVEAKGNLAPVVISEGTLGNDRELRVSPLHRMLITHWRAELMFGEPEVLVPAKHLVNGDTIYTAEGGEVEYFHMLFDQHEIVTANGAASESFHPGAQAMNSLEDAMREEIFSIFPNLRSETDDAVPMARLSLKTAEARAFLN
jgi:Ca2+-binding RTX toxin-like protein